MCLLPLLLAYLDKSPPVSFCETCQEDNIQLGTPAVPSLVCRAMANNFPAVFQPHMYHTKPPLNALLCASLHKQSISLTPGPILQVTSTGGRSHHSYPLSLKAWLSHHYVEACESKAFPRQVQCCLWPIRRTGWSLAAVHEQLHGVGS